MSEGGSPAGPDAPPGDAGPTGPDARLVLLLCVGGETFALPVAVVREVLHRPRITPVPLTSGGAVGLVNLRGEILPLFDTGRITGRSPDIEATFSVVVETSRGAAVLTTDSMPRHAVLETQVGQSDSTAGSGLHRVEGDLVTLLDVEGLFNQLVAGVSASS